MVSKNAIEEYLNNANEAELEAIADAIYGYDGVVIDNIYAFNMSDLDDVASTGSSVLELLRKFDGFNPYEDMFRAPVDGEYESLSHAQYVADLHNAIGELADFIVENADNKGFRTALPQGLQTVINEAE